MITADKKQRESAGNHHNRTEILGMNHEMPKPHCSHLFLCSLFLHCSFTPENHRNHYWLAFHYWCMWKSLADIGFPYFMQSVTMKTFREHGAGYTDVDLVVRQWHLHIEQYSLCYSTLVEPDVAAWNEIQWAAVTSWCRWRMVQYFCLITKVDWVSN